MYLDGFKYWLAYTKGDKRYFMRWFLDCARFCSSYFFISSYYRCFRSKTMKCPGKIAMESGKVKHIYQHSHEKETKINIVDKFRKVLTKKAIEKRTKPLVEIYLEETLNFTEASILYPFQSAESTMRKARAKHKPKTNKQPDVSIDCDQQQMESRQQLQKHYCHEDLHEHGTTVIFMHQYSVKLLGKIEEIHVDCSISCKSEDSDNENLHLITVLAIVKNQDYPIAFGLVRSKSVEVFSSFFVYIRDKAPTAMLPNNILTSCDVNLQEALRISFPEATIKVMWFFYASSVLKFAKENGMLKLMNKSLFHLSSLKMILAIPLIPSNYMIPGLDSLKKWMSEKTVNFEGLCEYVDASWLKSDGAERISIFNGLSHSINNYVQNFNRDLLHTLSLDELKKPQLFEAITKQASRAIKKLNRLKGTPILKKSQKLQKTILDTATHNWVKANIHLRRPIQFLQQVSHCIDDGMINFLINYDVGHHKAEGFIVRDPTLKMSDFITIVPPMLMTEPPPLIFFSKATTVVRPKTLPPSEPPPLVAISNKQIISPSHPTELFNEAYSSSKSRI